MISRAWTYIDEDGTEAREDEDGNIVHDDDGISSGAVRSHLDDLAREWSMLMTNRENAGFVRDDEGYEDFLSELDEEEYKDHMKRERVRDEKEQLRLEAIERELSFFGARMMRPYEHWNEEERMMEYLETRYDTEY